MREFLNAIIIIAYHIYSDEHRGPDLLLPWCVSQIITENILKNPCKVGGSLFEDPSRAIEAIKYMPRSWDIYCGLCVPNTYYPHEPIFRSRQFMFMLSDFRLINSDLNPREVLQILAKDNPELAHDDFCNLELEMTFLEFYEALIDCATVFVTEAVLKGHLSPKATPVPSSRSQSPASFTPATSKPGLESPDEDQYLQTINSATDTPGGGGESPDRVSRVMSGASDVKLPRLPSTDSPTKSREAVVARTTSAKSTELLPSSQEGSKRIQSVPSSANAAHPSSETAGFEEGEVDNLAEVQSPSLGIQGYPSQVDLQPDQQHSWCLQLDIFFEKFFQAADNLEMIKQAQTKKA